VNRKSPRDEWVARQELSGPR